jgi:hypothetical protein
MPAIPSFRLSPEQLEKYSYKATVASEYCLNQINSILVDLCDDEKASALQSEPNGEPTVTKTKTCRATNTRTASSKKQSKTKPTSQTTEVESLLDRDIPSEASPAATFIASTSELSRASCPASSSSSSKRSSFTWRRKSSQATTRVRAQAGEAITSRCRMGDASVEGDFASIRFGTYNRRPACHIMVDFRLVFQPTSTINSAQIQFRFGSDAGTTGAQATKSFFPDELTGQYDTTQEIRAINPNIGLGLAGCKASISGMSQQQARVKRRQWRVQGTREEHEGVYDTFCWKVMENEFSEDSVPRHFRTGMVVYLPSTSETNAEHQADFWVDISVEGTLRGLRSKHNKVQERRWFEPTLAERERRDTLDASALVEMVREENKKILDLVPAERTPEGGPALPALPASAPASVDVPAKPTTATQPQGHTDSGPRHCIVTSYEMSETQGMVHALIADGVVSLPS